MNCDKAWHANAPVKASVVLTCADCGKVYARCDECNKGVTSCAISMRAHFGRHFDNKKLKQKVMPNAD